MKRRHLLQLGAAAALTPWAQMQALAQTAPASGGYRALVCLFLFGGNDGNNLLVPTDSRYTTYQRARPNLALDKATLLPLRLGNASGLALHPALAGLQALVNAGQASVVANVGPLLVPTLKAQWEARSVPLPANLFSHSDQQGAWQSGTPEGPGRNGWGGRLLERAVAEGQANRGYAAISLLGARKRAGIDVVLELTDFAEQVQGANLVITGEGSLDEQSLHGKAPVGVAQAALNDAVSYAQQRESFGKPIWKHQSVGNLIADMATKVRAARLMTIDAAQRLDEGKRADMEAGMAKLFASEAAMEVALDAIRVHGGYGYSREYDVERYFRDAPLMIVGEGTNEIQRNVIAAQVVARDKSNSKRNI